MATRYEEVSTLIIIDIPIQSSLLILVCLKLLGSLHGLILQNTITALSINPLDASGLPRRLPFNIDYQIPPIPCLCNPSLPNSVRYATLLFEEKNGYPLWCPEPNEGPSVPGEHSETGIQIGDVRILHRDTPFDFLFNITYAADHPINQGGVPPGFTPLSNNLSKTWHTRHRDYDGHVTAPKYMLTTNQVPEEELGSGINRMYTFTSLHQQGAILMLPEGSSLSKLESKAEFRKPFIDGDLNSSFPLLKSANSEAESRVVYHESKRAAYVDEYVYKSSQAGPDLRLEPSLGYITLLNNRCLIYKDFQSAGDPTALSYEELVQGPSDKATWTVRCKVNGVLVQGEGIASTKAAAKDVAAQKAYESLLVNLGIGNIELFG
ncbi:hypothetical protein VNI00_018819 [Paramarasmius palmivorus]|uniref:DRBM domain-containing protein n=1 Tax=Paramarasmius palmivorus TaxID=297713 RepID=A0AAW0AVT3_9AGAR